MIRRFVFVASLLLVVGALLYYWFADEPAGVPQSAASVTRDAPSRPSASSVAPRSGGAESASASAAPSTVKPAAATSASIEADFPIAAQLNAPGSTIARDLDVMSQLLEAWQSNFPHEGNPVGENAEITAALLGDNRASLALIPKGHRAVNERGELCDRWGTPFRFHQLSGTRMEIRSAGPDRRFATDDDAVWTPQ